MILLRWIEFSLFVGRTFRSDIQCEKNQGF
jgi:hypothetical protein